MSKDVKVEEFRVMEFLKNLQIPIEDKKKLLLGIAAVMVDTSENTARLTTAACMGLSPDDEKFNAFYNSDIKPTLQVDIQSIYNQLSDKIISKEDE